jgi:hypothetical protein
LQCSQEVQQLLACPFSIDFQKAPDNLQLELIDLQTDDGLKEKFRSVKCADFLDCYVIPNTASSKSL